MGHQIKKSNVPYLSSYLSPSLSGFYSKTLEQHRAIHKHHDADTQQS